MSFEPETNDTIIRQIREEIARIREEQFAVALPTNETASSSAFGGSSGTALPNIGTSASPPQRINVTIDTGVIDKLDYDSKSPSKDFSIGETVTGQNSGASAVIGDIDITSSTEGTLILVPGSLTGTPFTDGENLNGSIGGTNIADADGIEFTTVGRGHLNARATTIIAQGLTSTFELHFLDGAIANGQQIWLRPANGQTMIIRRPVTTDGNTGNIDFNESVSVGENQLILLQFHAESNVTPDGGWIPASNVSGGVASGSFGLPIIYDVDDKGDLNGLVSVSIDLSATTGHVTEVRLIEDVANPGVSISQTIGITGAPPDNKAIPFYLRVEQDSLGGHTIVLPATVFPVPTINTAPNSISTIMLFTSDNGVSFQSMRMFESAGAGNQTPWLSDIDANTFDLFRIDKLRFLGAGGFSFPVDNNIQGISTAGAGLQFNVPLSQSFRFFVGGDDINAGEMLRINQFGFDFFDNNLVNIQLLSFTDPGSFSSSIFPDNPLSRLTYNTSGLGSHHGFTVGGGDPKWEVRVDVNRSNNDLDMITNNIFDVDVVEWASTGGFLAGTNHGIRSIGGGNTGIELNVPSGKTFRILVENLGLTDSDIQYEFTENKMLFNQNQIDDILGIRFTNGVFFADILTEFDIIGGRQNESIPDSEPQPMIFKSLEKTGFDTYVTRDIFTIDAREFFGGGGMKMHTDLNLQTQNINNVDVLKFIPDGGVIVGTEYAMGADFSDTGFNFNVPLDRDYVFNNNANPIAVLDPTGLQLFANPSSLNPQMGAREFSLTGGHTLGTTGMLDGSFRLVGSNVFVHTGGNPVNLSSGFGTSFIGFTADADLDMGTFNIFNMDVLRYAVDGGTIGSGEYGSAVEADGSKLKWSIPSGKRYEWQINLDPVADMNTASFHMRSNLQTVNPSIITDGSFFLGLTHTLGSVGMFDGESRLVNNAGSQDVIFKSGGNLVNLTTLIVGSGVNAGDDVTWTGDHIFNGSQISINSPAIFIGNQTTDQVLFTARIANDFIPVATGNDFGSPSLRWDAFIRNLDIGADADFNNFDIDSVGDIEINGALNHDGSTIGFFGTTPQSKGTVDLQGTLLFQVTATLADLLGQLRDYGMINTNV